MKIRHTLRAAVLALLLLCLSVPARCEAPADSLAAVLRARLDSLLADGIFDRTQLGLAVMDLTADSMLYEHNARQLMRPASNEKIVTAVAALTQLGTGYTYRTLLLAQDCVDDSVLTGGLCLRAAFDPLLGADDVRDMARAVAARGIRRVEGGLAVDLTMKDTLRWGWGWCWDDDMPDLVPDLYRGRPGLADALREALALEGVQVEGPCTVRRAGAEDTLVLASCTRTIDQVLLPVMKKSDNLAAESLFYHLAAASARPYAGRRQAVERIDALIRAVGLRPDHYQIADGSGVSLYNYLTPQLLVALLRYAYVHPAIYRHLLPSLPVAGEDGTLARRMRGTAAQGNVRAKTGTVEGVSTLSGYATAANGHVLCFSIMNQGIRHTSTGRNFQDRVCRALTEP